MSATGAYTYVKTCYECRADFETWDGEEELCPTCQREYLRETCPEALAEWDDQWAEGVILPTATTAFTPPCLMSVSELCAYHRSYEIRIAAHLTGVGNGLGDQERAHAYEVGREYAAWQDALRWSFERPS